MMSAVSINQINRINFILLIDAIDSVNCIDRINIIDSLVLNCSALQLKDNPNYPTNYGVTF